MGLLDLASILVALAAVFSFINHRWLGLPSTIGLLLIALMLSIGLVLLSELGWALPAAFARHLAESAEFDHTLLHGMLSFLLFAGALHVNLEDLNRQKGLIALLATAGVVISTLLIGAASWLVLQWFDLAMPFIYCLVFGALISPTDPIAVLAIMKKVGAPKSLETKIAGESLFNDGVGVVLFLVLAEVAVAADGAPISPTDVLGLFITEAGGGMALGALLGGIAFWMLRQVDQYQVEVLLTLALVMGGYSLATALHMSGPIAIVVAGLLIGNHGRLLAMSDRTRERLDNFWELIDEILNALLFILIGLEVLLIQYRLAYLEAGLLMVPLVLAARFVAVAIPVAALSRFRQFTPGVCKILTWAGLRGGISVALALSLPQGPERELILVLTYVIVIFSIVGQGLTIGKVLGAQTKGTAD